MLEAQGPHLNPGSYCFLDWILEYLSSRKSLCNRHLTLCGKQGLTRQERKSLDVQFTEYLLLPADPDNLGQV